MGSRQALDITALTLTAHARRFFAREGGVFPRVATRRILTFLLYARRRMLRRVEDKAEATAAPAPFVHPNGGRQPGL